MQLYWLADCHQAALVPIRAGAKLGRTSAPRLPHRLQMNLGARSDSLTSSGHLHITFVQRLRLLAAIHQNPNGLTNVVSADYHACVGFKFAAFLS
jgi:hypothetical protein